MRTGTARPDSSTASRARQTLRLILPAVDVVQDSPASWDWRLIVAYLTALSLGLWLF